MRSPSDDMSRWLAPATTSSKSTYGCRRDSAALKLGVYSLRICLERTYDDCGNICPIVYGSAVNSQFPDRNENSGRINSFRRVIKRSCLYDAYLLDLLPWVVYFSRRQKCAYKESLEPVFGRWTKHKTAPPRSRHPSSRTSATEGGSNPRCENRKQSRSKKKKVLEADEIFVKKKEERDRQIDWVEIRNTAAHAGGCHRKH